MSYKLEIEGLGKYFREPDGKIRQVLDSITLNVVEGQFISIVGASGSGKTTFLRCIAGLLPHEEGVIRIDKAEMNRLSSKCGFVFQSDSLMPWRTVKQNIAFGLQVRRLAAAEIDAITNEIIGMVGLTGFNDHYPSEVSGGMRQRANLARALAIDPTVLLMDEPFAALDAQTREIMQSELLKIWAQRMKTVLFITHQIDEAVYLADRVVVFSGRPGHLVADIPIPFPRPRALLLKRSPEFVGYIDHIWSLIEHDVVTVMNAAVRNP